MPTAIESAPATLQPDLRQRLEDLPSTAMVRGVFFRLLEEEIIRRRVSVTKELGELLGRKDAWRLYPARDLMTAYARTASLIDADPGEGLRALFFGIAPSYAKTWYGQLFRKFLGDLDPAKALRYVERARERVSNYGKWRLETVAPRHVVLHMFDEYFWIESAQRGGCEGLLDACGVAGEVHVELDTPYRGALDIRWNPRES